LTKTSRILFLFNHDAAHQAAHIASLAAEVANRDQAEVIVAYGTDAIRQTVESLLPAGAAQRMTWTELSLPPLTDAVLAPLNKLAPVRRLKRLDQHLDLFASVDLIVSPERTCLRVKRKLGARAPKFIFVPHGAGDRSVTYHPEMAQFDYMLVSGQKVVDEMQAHGIISPERCEVIGYPKFDTVDLKHRPRFFDNGRPTFLYNPHFDPHLSSWYDMGRDVIDYFAGQQDRYNLIVAPHVMLFRKKLHYSLEYRSARLRPDVPSHLPSNILVDLDSPRLFDMSYTRSADAYIGDVSSQVYEFLTHRGACFFLDSAGQVGEDGALPYQFWENGDVCGDVQELARWVPLWDQRAETYRATQDRLFQYTMDIDPQRNAAQRGADALLAYAQRL
jgi:hypothetical protein